MTKETVEAPIPSGSRWGSLWRQQKDNILTIVVAIILAVMIRSLDRKSVV